MSHFMPQIPGYYYDATRNRYFKVVNHPTAPAQSAWSSDAVKKRKLEDDKMQRAAERMKLNKNRVKRSPALMRPLHGGDLSREIHGSVQQDMGPTAIAANLVHRGSILFNDARWGASQNMSCMSVIGKDKFTDLGFAYISPDGNSIASSYIPRDGKGQVHRRLIVDGGYSVPGNRAAPYHEGEHEQVSAIKFDHHRNFIITASSRPEPFIPLRVHRVVTMHKLWKDCKRPFVRLGQVSNVGTPISIPASPEMSAYHHPFGLDIQQPTDDYYEIHALAIPDIQTRVICAIGSNRGILRYDESLITSLSADSMAYPMTTLANPNQGLHWAAPSPLRPTSFPPQSCRDIFTVDFLRGHDMIILGGGRPGRCLVTDARVRDDHWQSFQHGTSITHIKSLNQHHVLVSGTRNKMCIYDLRMVDREHRTTSDGPDKWKSLHSKQEPALSLVDFPEYKNNAHIKIGFDVDIEAGIVATAHDDGRVALHSLQSGNQLESPAIDMVKADVESRGPIKTLQFAKMNNDAHSSLFVGAGSTMKVFSYGPVMADDDEA
ncbi:hypothetical protein PFICI_11414 [Pestalotiopsis fici W106-1]|uniref:Myocyte-specific enhancer factor 2d n=1 Tax=Pestalotiopsis fici (strain W106-1 / CGMCC3.15140) TaxID=1229662 RepID=W3WUL9_PESFW|nr:uncharacterized protein PFICI_11414 [Pestalotiopsis fici W106-1]ETS77540.1 hypothetical protein PFICI_11414 [Pestalotiopsis fici W106-1]